MMSSVKIADAKRDSTYGVAVTVVGGNRPAFTGTLLSIGSGQLHFRSDRWVEPGRQIAAGFDHIAVKGTVIYCKWRNEGGYLTCVDVATESAQQRREPRFPIDMPGTVILLGNHGASLMNGVIRDISSSGLGLRIPSEAPVSSTVCVETATLLVVGEVRHCSTVPSGFSVGVLLTDVFSDQAEPRRRSRSTLMEKTRTLGRAIFGNGGTGTDTQSPHRMPESAVS
jgi:hypothetical protein